MTVPAPVPAPEASAAPTETPTVAPVPGPPAFKAPADQAALDRIVSDRIERERAKFADYDVLKSAAAELAKIKEGEKTELQKAQDVAAAASAERDKLLGRLKDTALTGAIAAANAELKSVLSPAETLALIGKDSLTVSEDGTVEGLADKLKSFYETHPHFVGAPTAPTGTPGLGNVSKPPTTNTRPDGFLTREQAEGLSYDEYTKRRADVLASMKHWK